jgi:hypothetical protein
LVSDSVSLCVLFVVRRFIRLHHFDANYLTMPDYIPADLK